MTDTNSATAQIEARARSELLRRLESGLEYRRDEISEIEAIDHRLLPPTLDLDSETVERLRALARLSRCELAPASKISSHRPYVGKLIVFAKRLTWPFIRTQLKGTFDALEEFNTLLLETLVAEIVRQRQLQGASPSSAGYVEQPRHAPSR